jgi:glycerol-3-phosphate dehydrogenase (NAD(P)+)
MSFPSIGIVGAGSWGTALAVLLGGKNLPVALWGHDAAHIDHLAATRTNEACLPGVALPPSVSPTTSLSEVTAADLVIFVTPSKATREVAERLSRRNLPSKATILSCTKGIERGSSLRMSQVLGEIFAQNTIAVLSGPSHAEEVALNMPTAVVVGCTHGRITESLVETVSTRSFRVYSSDDLAGIELGGALKNIYAIAAGVSDGLALGDNAKAALITRSLTELIRIGTVLGGRRETFQGLSGIGDLMVTCYSRHSRNRKVGERIGRGETLDEISRSMTMVAEGIPTTLSTFECARRMNIRTPVLDQMHAILYENKAPRDAVMDLLSRDPRPEADSHRP